jgi:hypothetical protein
MAIETTGADLGYLAVLSRDNANSPMTYSQIAEVTNIPGFGAMSDLLEVTHLNSPNGAKEYISGLEDGVELTITCNLRLDHASQSYSAGLIRDQRIKSTRRFSLTHPQWGGTFYFYAVVRGFAMDISPNEAQVVTFTLKLTGGLSFG